MRVVLVANNPRASLAGIQNDDCVVQFNHCEHYDRLAGHKGPRIFAWRRNACGAVSGWHGAEPMHDYAGDLHIILGGDEATEYHCERRGWPVTSLTVPPPHYPRGIPSTGFWVLHVLHRLGLPVALCGFTHGPAWPGHDWQYEREWVAARNIARI